MAALPCAGVAGPLELFDLSGFVRMFISMDCLQYMNYTQIAALGCHVISDI